MKSQRMNSEIRLAIIDAAVGRFIDQSREERAAKEKAFLAKWPKKIYNAIYPAPMRKRMNALPKGALPETGQLRLCVYVSVGNKRENGEDVLNQRYMYLKLGTNHRVFHEHASRYMSNDELGEAGIDVQEMYDEYKAIENDDEYAEYENKRKELSAFLKQFNTTKQLVEAWPEGEKFLPKPKTPGSDLMIAPESINKLLGIAA